MTRSTRVAKLLRQPCMDSQNRKASKLLLPVFGHYRNRPGQSFALGVVETADMPSEFRAVIIPETQVFLVSAAISGYRLLLESLRNTFFELAVAVSYFRWYKYFRFWWPYCYFLLSSVNVDVFCFLRPSALRGLICSPTYQLFLRFKC